MLPTKGPHPAPGRARRREGALILSGVLAGAFTAAAPGAAAFFPREPWAARRVALTFDDGPHPAYTGRLLDLLRSGGARATFFVVGRQAERNPRLLREILRRGSELANHTYRHPRLTALGPAAVLAELDRTQRLLTAAGGGARRFFRPPGGRFNENTLAAARSAGYDMVLWTALPRDHEGPPPEDIVRRVLTETGDGGVILLHSGAKGTLSALPLLLRELRGRGFRCVTVSELLAERGASRAVDAWLNPAAPPRRPVFPPDDETDPGD